MTEHKKVLDPKSYLRRMARNGDTLWTDRAGRKRASFPHRADADIMQDATGADAFDRIGYVGGSGLRIEPRGRALEALERLLERRGFDPSAADEMLSRY